MDSSKGSCPTLDSRGSHSYTAAAGAAYDQNGDAVDMVCRDCGATLRHDEPLPRFNSSRDWKDASAGHVFAEDCNSDGTLRTPAN